jgi:hypothetical protein
LTSARCGVFPPQVDMNAEIRAAFERHRWPDAAT